VADPADLSELRREPDETLLGGERKYTRVQVSERAGISIERAERIWHALGFATVPDDEVAFTDSDIEAARLLVALEEDGFIDPAIESSLARKFGQTQSRLASWRAAMFLSLLRESRLDAEDALEVAALLVPAMERVQTYVWRRHLAAAAGRAVASTGDASHGTRVVGFADIVSYTRLTRRLTEPGQGLRVCSRIAMRERSTVVIREHARAWRYGSASLTPLWRRPRVTNMTACRSKPAAAHRRRTWQTSAPCSRDSWTSTAPPCCGSAKAFPTTS
jgi:hypothetical protein